MAVIFAVVGGGAVIAIARTDPYSDHSYHSDYGDYDNYSDEAERRNRRIAAKQEEVRQGVQEVNQYKIDKVNAYLENSRLVAEPGETVSVDEVRKDGCRKIDRDQNKKIAEETRSTTQELNDINTAISSIDKILEDRRS